VFTRTMFFDQRTTEPKGLLRAQIVNGQVLTVSRVSRMLVKESYRVDPITGRLFATFIVQNPKSRRPLTVERVYDRSLTAKRCK
jgi:hypothetical protein